MSESDFGPNTVPVGQAFVDTLPGSQERLLAIDRMDYSDRATGRSRKVSEFIIPEDGPSPPERTVSALNQRIRDAAADGTVLAVKYGVVLALWLYAGFMVGRAFVDLESQRVEAAQTAKELKEQMSTVGPQALRGQQAFQFLSQNEKAVVSLVNSENERLKAAQKK